MGAAEPVFITFIFLSSIEYFLVPFFVFSIAEFLYKAASILWIDNCDTSKFLPGGHKVRLADRLAVRDLVSHTKNNLES